MLLVDHRHSHQVGLRTGENIGRCGKPSAHFHMRLPSKGQTDDAENELKGHVSSSQDQISK